MKKKILVLVLALSMMITLVACGNKNDAAEGNNTVAENVEEVDHDHDHDDHDDHDHDEEHTHGEYEWIGEFELEKGVYLLHFGASPDETLDVGFVKLGDNITDLDHHAAHLMDIEDKEVIAQDSQFEAKPDYVYTIEMDPEHGHVNFEIMEDGTYAIVTEHHPSENNLQVFDSNDVEILPINEHEGHDH